MRIRTLWFVAVAAMVTGQPASVDRGPAPASAAAVSAEVILCPSGGTDCRKTTHPGG